MIVIMIVNTSCTPHGTPKHVPRSTTIDSHVKVYELKEVLTLSIIILHVELQLQNANLWGLKISSYTADVTVT